jgi:4-hydroxy-2-oxoheptanedioate aldolase
MNRLFQKIAADELALGVWIKGGPQFVTSIARAGFDFVRPDMMFSALDWKELDHIHRTAESMNIATWLRIATNPWLDGPGSLQMTVDAARAFSLGVPVVQVSIASAAQVRALVAVAQDWHRSGAGEYPNSNESFKAQSKRAIDTTMVVPAIESATAIEQLDEILEIEGLRAIQIACTDFSKMLGYPFEYEHPAVWKKIDELSQKARKKGILVVANTGYDFTTPEQITGRVRRLYDHGVRVVLMQGADFLFETFSRSLIEKIAQAGR